MQGRRRHPPGLLRLERRPPSARELADRELGERIRQIHAETEGSTARRGSTPSCGSARDPGRPQARRPADAAARAPRRRRQARRAAHHRPRPERASAPDLVDRDFARAEPNRLWVCDLKYVQTGQGFLFLAAVQDVFSRRIIGWSMRDDLRAELVLDALGMAVSQRGADTAGVVAHSDHGSQYTSLVYGAYAKQSGIDLSMGSIGDPGTTRSPRRFFASARERAAPPRALRDPRAGPDADLLVHRVLLQRPPQALQPRHLSPADYEQRHQQEANRRGRSSRTGRNHQSQRAGASPRPAVKP